MMKERRKKEELEKLLKMDRERRKRNEELEKLLKMEKTRRGVDNESPVFVGMGNIAKYYWCAECSALSGRNQEATFFATYLTDRIRYAYELGYIKELPEKNKDILKVGDEITLKDINKILRDKEKMMETGESYTLAQTLINEDGEKVMFINENLDQKEIEMLEEEARKEGIRIANLEESPIIRGTLLEESRGERYPSVRWNFEWGKYVVVGLPDGITDQFVYEFKTTKTRFLIRYIKPVALTQADLYGYFFQRERKRVQINIVPENVTETWEELVNRNRAEETLSNFAKVDEGEIPLPPKPWKCKKCEFKSNCRLQG